MIVKRGVFVALITLAVVSATDMPAQNDGPFNYGRRWNAWSLLSRSIYLEGFRDGQSHAYFALVDDLPQARRESIRLATFTFYDADALGSVMTSLYADPANTYIQHDDMVYIARDKLSGKDVELALRSARSRGATPR
jgi:hypothetical protein